jgi:CDP-diacylglycerol--glycerol-3-phosphate 3-phosphatidyltransferase
MANLITIARIALLFVTIGLIYEGGVQTITACIFLIIFVFASDGIDGWVARRRKSTSAFGAVFDIASDRIVENALWVIFADLGLIPIWIPLLVLTRGFLVDGIRSISYGEGKTAFGADNMMRSPLTTWLTAGRFMRALYGYAKTLAFVFLTGLQGYENRNADGTVLGRIYDIDVVRWTGWGLVGIAVTLTVVRALPVIIDALALYGPNSSAAAESSKKDS